ncbi:glycosyltransferase [Oceanimonas doudoroffii]|uniref:Glycosyl transferase family 1 domain-containing protein n=1 Tax=Oceanimonas doudoroffii TaxID=84158 RepID=A0A233RER6_9GAMM|nr:glycosyltransferase [Oceanimonas doudoroffii]OXY81883.1 hypothetical protein B6S08_10550 [Oceanimonas doudoroffii]
MKIILVTDLYPTSEKRNGNDQTQAVKDLILSAQEFGLEVSAVIRFQQFLKKKFKFCDILPRCIEGQVYDVPLLGIRGLFIKIYTKLIVSHILKNKEYDLIVFHMSLNAYRYLSLNIREEVPKVLVVHKGDFKHNYLKRCINEVDAVFSRSHSISEELDKKFNLKDVQVLYSGIPSSFFFHSSGGKVACNNEEFFDCKLIYAGELKSLKNIDSVILSIKSLVDFGFKLRFDIYGVGPEEKNLKELAKNINVDSVVQFHGWIDRECLPEKFFQSDLFVMPSCPETFGLVYLEAMANGCVILGHKNEGIDGVVQDGVNAFMVEHATHNLITDKIKSFINLKSQEKSYLRKNVARIASGYDSRSSGLNYYRAMKSVLEDCSNKFGND